MNRAIAFRTAVLVLALPAGMAAQRPAAACCKVTAIDAASGVITAQVTASGLVFELKPRNPATLGAIKVGQPVHANFTNNQISLDGRTLWGTVTKAPQSVAGGSRSGINVTQAAPAATRRALPQVTYGEPVPISRTTVRDKLAQPMRSHRVEATVGGRRVSAQIVHLRGHSGIKNAPVHDDVRRLLEMHRRTLRLGDPQYYLVDPALAAEWIKTHDVPDDVKPKDDGGGNDENCSDDGNVWDIVVNCTNEGLDQAEMIATDVTEAIAAEFERNRKKAEDWWKEKTGELEDAWKEFKGCFTDATLPGPSAPVKFSISPTMSVDMTQSRSKGSASGTLSGSVRLGIPLQADFQAEMEFFYIPCLPFVFRPKQLRGDGSITVGQQLTVSVDATGSFNKRYTIPPTGGPVIPLYVIPIVIGHVPVAEVDISAYVEGEVDVTANGSVKGQFSVANSHRSTFGFKCDGSGCDGTDRGSTSPTTTNESAQIQGDVTVKPGIYTALQINFDYNVLGARVGPQPYLIGVAEGCAAGSASQTSGGASTTQTNSALTADLDWAVKVRAEALAGGKVVGKRWETKVRDTEHLWYKDLAPGGSSALVPSITGAAQAVAAQPTSVKVRMPSCYPYQGPVQYRISWTGGATPAPNAACQWQGAGGTCSFDAAKDLPLSLTWPGAGAHTLSISLIKDDHLTFSPAPPPARLNVSVTAGTGGTP